MIHWQWLLITLLVGICIPWQAALWPIQMLGLGFIYAMFRPDHILLWAAIIVLVGVMLGLFFDGSVERIWFLSILGIAGVATVSGLTMAKDFH